MKNLCQCLHGHYGGRVLDVATGRGEFIKRLMTDLENYTEIIGVDTSERFISMAREQFTAENIHFLQMDGVSLQFADASFDTVTLSNSLHHLALRDETLTEMLRVLKPGGLFVISEMYRDNQAESQLSHVYLHHWAAKIDRLLGDTHDETYTRRELVAIAQSLNLRDLQYADFYIPDDDPMDQEGIQSVLTVLERSVERVKDYPEYSTLKAEADELKARILDVGITGSTQLIITGRK